MTTNTSKIISSAPNHQNELRREEQKLKAEKRKLVVLSGGNCLTCKFTKVALGKRLLCKAKQNKLVTQYNYCEKYQSLIPSVKSPESKE